MYFIIVLINQSRLELSEHWWVLYLLRHYWLCKNWYF